MGVITITVLMPWKLLSNPNFKTDEAWRKIKLQNQHEDLKNPRIKREKTVWIKAAD